LVWTGKSKSEIHPNPALPQIWASATLYSPAVQIKRKVIFHQFIKDTPIPGLKTLLLLLQQCDDPENSFLMNRKDAVKTCSISLLEIKQQEATFEYYDLLQVISKKIPFNFEPRDKFIEAKN
jgi:hypothetical protein